jgi:hypothetical protein
LDSVREAQAIAARLRMGFLSLPARPAKALGQIAEWKGGQRFSRGLPATEFDGAAPRGTDSPASCKHRDLQCRRLRTVMPITPNDTPGSRAKLKRTIFSVAAANA